MFSEREYRKSFNYMCRIYSNQIKEGIKTYEKSKKVISINIIKSDYKRQNKELVNRYEMQNKVTNKVVDNGEIEMVLVRIDKVYIIQYNKLEKRFIRWLRIIGARSIEEMESYAKGDKFMEDSVEYVKRYLSGPLNHTIEDYIAEKVLKASEAAEIEGKKQGVEIGKKRGEKIGEKRGVEIGKKKGIIEIAKNLLSLNIDKKDIMTATGLTEQELLKLAKSME